MAKNPNDPTVPSSADSAAASALAEKEARIAELERQLENTERERQSAVAAAQAAATASADAKTPGSVPPTPPSGPLVKYRAAGADYSLKLADNGDLVQPDTGAVAVTGAKRVNSGEPLTEGTYHIL